MDGLIVEAMEGGEARRKRRMGGGFSGIADIAMSFILSSRKPATPWRRAMNTVKLRRLSNGRQDLSSVANAAVKALGGGPHASAADNAFKPAKAERHSGMPDLDDSKDAPAYAERKRAQAWA